MIDKRIAGVLYSYGYQLKDNEGNVYSIEGVENCPYDNDEVTLELMGHKLQRITNKEIGSTYKILAREMDLTKPIEGVGVPYHELLKLAVNIPDIDVNKISFNEKMNQLELEGRKGLRLAFAFDKTDNSFIMLNRGVSYTCCNQLSLFNWLYTHHFNFFPEGSTTNLI